MDEKYEAYKEVVEKRSAETEGKLNTAKNLLLRRLRNRAVPVVFDDAPSFTIMIHVPSPDLRRRLIMIRKEVIIALEKEDEETLLRLDDEWAQHLADLCVDPDLDKAFWKDGKGFDVDVPTRLMNVAMGQDLAEREASKSFRDEPEGPSNNQPN